MARAGLALGGIALIGVGAAIALGWWWPSTAQETARLTEAVDTVEIASDDGDVTIRTAATDRTTIRQRFDYSWGEPEQGYTVSDGVLTLGGCGSWCSVSYEVTVPPGARVSGSSDSGDLTLSGLSAVDVHADSGEVAVNDVTGSATVEADSGDIELRGVGGQSTLRADSGSITASEVAGSVEANLSSGDLELDLSEPTDVSAELDSGDATLTVPHAPYRVAASTDSGDRDIDVRRDSTAEQSLEVSTSSGDVTVRTAG